MESPAMNVERNSLLVLLFGSDVTGSFRRSLWNHMLFSFVSWVVPVQSLSWCSLNITHFNTMHFHSVILCQVVRGPPTLLLPIGNQVSAFLGSWLGCILKTWPCHCHRSEGTQGGYSGIIVMGRCEQGQITRPKKGPIRLKPHPKYYQLPKT